MEGKKVLNLNDFLSNGWKRLRQLSFKTSIEVKHHPAIFNVKNENLNQEYLTNETEKFNVEAVRINELLFTEKTKIIIHGNLL